MIGASKARDMAGLDYLRAMIDGEIPAPPIVALMDMTLVSATDGEATFTCLPNESHYNPIGAVHGGFACTVLDSAAGCAVHSTLAAGLGYTSLDLGIGSDDYKRLFCKGDEPIFDSFIPLTARGKFAAIGMSSLTHAKRMVKHNPALMQMAQMLRGVLHR